MLRLGYVRRLRRVDEDAVVKTLSEQIFDRSVESSSLARKGHSNTVHCSNEMDVSQTISQSSHCLSVDVVLQIAGNVKSAFVTSNLMLQKVARCISRRKDNQP